MYLVINNKPFPVFPVCRLLENTDNKAGIILLKMEILSSSNLTHLSNQKRNKFSYCSDLHTASKIHILGLGGAVFFKLKFLKSKETKLGMGIFYKQIIFICFKI